MVADSGAEESKEAALEYFRNMLEMAGVEREKVDLLITEMGKAPQIDIESRIDIDQLESGLRALVDALNRFDGITVTGSGPKHCDNVTVLQPPEGEWSITFRVDHSDQGWLALEFLAWFVHDNYKGRTVQLCLFSAPPHLNVPGLCLTFALEGQGEDPSIVAAFLDEMREAYYLQNAQ